MSWDLAEGTGQGDGPPCFTPADVADAERVRGARRRSSPRTSTRPTRGRTPTPRRLDALSSAAGCARRARAPARDRLYELGALAMGGGSVERQSLLG